MFVKVLVVTCILVLASLFIYNGTNKVNSNNPVAVTDTATVTVDTVDTVKRAMLND